MNFFRENLFMTVLVGGTVILSLILLLVGYSISGQIEDELMAERMDLSNKIQNLSRPPFHNGATIKSNRETVEGILRSLSEVRQQNVAWNSRNFKVPSLQTLSGGIRPSLPFDGPIWERNGLALHFLRYYHNSFDELLGRLKATSPPDEAQIQAEAQRQQEFLQRLEDIRTKGADERPARGAGVMPEGMEGEMMGLARRAKPAGRKPKPAGKARSGDEAMEIALAKSKLRKAREGLVYATADSFDIIFARGLRQSTLEPEKVWEAQVGLWVQSEIVAVLVETIKQVQDQQGLEQRDRSVLNSPIKRLERIEISGEFSDGKDASKKKKDPKKAAPMMGMEMGMEMEMMGGRSSRRGRKRKRSAPARTAKPLDRPDTLTQNTANPIFDVVDYSFTVLMPTRYLPLLEMNLMKRNYHVILNEQIATVESASSTGGKGDDEYLYYYGTEPVRRVTIQAQLLLLTDWTRGMWDVKQQKWLHQPLMPIDVLQKLDSQAPGAMRNEDRQLIQGKLPMPWKESTEKKGPDA